MRKALIAAVGLGAWWLGTSPADAQTSTSTTTEPGGSVLSLSSTGEIVFIAVVVAALAAVWFGITIYDRKSTNDWRKNNFAPLAEEIVRYAAPRATDPPMSTDEIKALANAVNSPPRGTPGLTRTLLALGLLALIGVALVSLVVGNGSNASDLLKTVVTALTGALTTILGFYFGAKTTSDATTPATTAPTGTTPKASASTAVAVPGAPTNIQSRPGPDAGSVIVSFEAPANDGGAAILNYTATAYIDGVPIVYVTKPQANADPITLLGLEAANNYTFTVHAGNRVGFGKESSASNPTRPNP